MAPVFYGVRWGVQSVQPRADGPRVLMASIPTGDLVAITSGPNDIGVSQIWNGEAGLATPHAAIPTGLLRIDGHAGAAHVSVVLHVAVKIVRNLIVDVDVVHLADGKSDVVEAAAVHGGDVHSGVIGDYKTIGIGGIHPDIVSVSSPTDFLEILSAIERLVERAVGNVNFIVGSRRNRDANVIAGASNQSPLEIDCLPVCAGVVGPPDRALILGLNQCKDTPGVCGSDGDVNLAGRSMR